MATSNDKGQNSAFATRCRCAQYGPTISKPVTHQVAFGAVAGPNDWVRERALSISCILGLLHREPRDFLLQGKVNQEVAKRLWEVTVSTVPTPTMIG